MYIIYHKCYYVHAYSVYTVHILWSTKWSTYPQFAYVTADLAGASTLLRRRKAQGSASLHLEYRNTKGPFTIRQIHLNLTRKDALREFFSHYSVFHKETQDWHWIPRDILARVKRISLSFASSEFFCHRKCMVHEETNLTTMESFTFTRCQRDASIPILFSW